MDSVSHQTEFYELEGEFYHRIAMTSPGRGGKRGDYLRANKLKAKRIFLNQYRYIRFMDKRAKANLNTKLFKIQPPPKPAH
ncbi:hypothetical protein OUN72_002796 [Salmonella enterica subsp. enterica serovar Essen]|nr:hypothetical protein [Salmonella enterica]